MEGGILLRNLRLVGVPGHGDCLEDVLIGVDGRIGEIGSGLEQPQGCSNHECAGAFASAGWIDLHCHVYEKVSEFGLNPDLIGESCGVTTIVDAGSAGEATFEGFKDYVAGSAKTRTLAFLNIGSIGLIKSSISEVYDISFIDVPATIRCAENHPALVCGIKVRASGVIVRDLGIMPLKLGKKCARVLGLPLLVHIGEPPPVLEEVLVQLDAGDIVTHCFNGKPGGNIFDNGGSLLPEAGAALDRGVLFDVGHGAASFSFAIGERAMQQGIVPHIISTDLHVRSRPGVVRDLATTMSKMLYLGMNLEEIIEAVTSTPARSIGRLELAAVKPGAEANITLFEVVKESKEVFDSLRQPRTLQQVIRPIATVSGTRIALAAKDSMDPQGLSLQEVFSV